MRDAKVCVGFLRRTANHEAPHKQQNKLIPPGSGQLTVGQNPGHGKENKWKKRGHRDGNGFRTPPHRTQRRDRGSHGGHMIQLQSLPAKKIKADPGNRPQAREKSFACQESSPMKNRDPNQSLWETQGSQTIPRESYRNGLQAHPATLEGEPGLTKRLESVVSASHYHVNKASTG